MGALKLVSANNMLLGAEGPSPVLELGVKAKKGLNLIIKKKKGVGN